MTHVLCSVWLSQLYIYLDESVELKFLDKMLNLCILKFNLMWLLFLNGFLTNLLIGFTQTKYTISSSKQLFIGICSFWLIDFLYSICIVVSRLVFRLHSIVTFKRINSSSNWGTVQRIFLSICTCAMSLGINNTFFVNGKLVGITKRIV